jgi:hypothetical protein
VRARVGGAVLVVAVLVGAGTLAVTRDDDPDTAVDVVPPPMPPTATSIAVDPVSPSRAAEPKNEPPTIRQPSPDRASDPIFRVEPRAAAQPATDLDVVPPAEMPPTPIAAEAPTRVDAVPTAVTAIAGAAAGGAAMATAETRRARDAKGQVIPLPRPAPPAEIRAVAASMPVTQSDKNHGRRRVGAYSKRGPLKLIGMLFGGWRN